MLVNAKYEKLADLFKEIALINSIQELLSWDELTFMPKGGAKHRADQTAYLADLKHRKITNPEIGGLLGELEAEGLGGEGLSVEDVNLREWRREYDLKTKLDADYVRELSIATSKAQEVWQVARAESNFTLFKPHLEKLIVLKRREAETLGYENELYDALLDQFEPGATTSMVLECLGGMREALIPLMQKVVSAPRKPDSSILLREFPIKAQEAFAREVATAIGYEFRRGSLDITTHPFCMRLGPDDVRMTTRYDKNYFNTAFFGVLHEAGHGLYELNLPAEHWGTPMAEYVSLGIHESQSRLWENIIGRSRAFWEYWYPAAQKYFTALEEVPLDDFHFAVNRVKPSFIRVEADEVTYNLHILMRFELERAMIEGDLPAADLPAAWNEKFEAYLGLKIPDDARGCLQDIHWSYGAFGYFPTYSCGDLAASQIMAKAREELGDIDDMLRRAEYQPLREWLREKVWSQGKRCRSARLVEVITGEPLHHQPLVKYLEEKLYGVYGVE